MVKQIFRILLCLFFISLASCLSDGASTSTSSTTNSAEVTTSTTTSNVAGDNEGSGTIVSNPKPPSSNVFPNFDNFIPDDSLSSSSDSAQVKTFFKYLYAALVPPSMAEESATVPTDLTAEDTPSIWNLIFTEGGFNDYEIEKNNAFNSLGSEIAAAIADAGITEITSTAQSFSTTKKTETADRNLKWNGEIVLDSNDSNYINIYLKETKHDTLNIKYSFTLGSDGNASKGIFAYTVGTTLDSVNNKRRFIGFAFDFTDSSKTQMIFRLRQYQASQEEFYGLHVHQQCNVDSNYCTGQYVDEYDINNYAFHWDENTNEICLARIDFSEDYVNVSETVQFTGPDTPSVSDVEEDVCSLTEVPEWGSHVYSDSDLPTEDYVNAVYGDGDSKTSLDTYITSDFIDTWLNATQFTP
jgi:hypothetical protein